MNANKINYYPNQIFDKYGLCMCGDCLSCRPDLFPIKPNQCVVCNCYNLSEFKKVERKHIHCLDCYKQVMNAKRKEQRKQKKELCKCCGKKHGDDECEGVNCGACNDHDYFPLTLLDGVMRCGFCLDDYNNGLEEDECECCDDDEEEDDGFEDCNVCGYAHHYEDKCPNETTCEHYEKSEKCECCGEHIDEMTFEDLCEYVNDMDGSDVSEGWGRDEIIAMIKEMNK